MRSLGKEASKQQFNLMLADIFVPDVHLLPGYARTGCSACPSLTDDQLHASALPCCLCCISSLDGMDCCLYLPLMTVNVLHPGSASAAVAPGGSMVWAGGFHLHLKPLLTVQLRPNTGW